MYIWEDFVRSTQEKSEDGVWINSLILQPCIKLYLDNKWEINGKQPFQGEPVIVRREANQHSPQVISGCFDWDPFFQMAQLKTPVHSKRLTCLIWQLLLGFRVPSEVEKSMVS